jgi:hypothetical protein
LIRVTLARIMLACALGVAATIAAGADDGDPLVVVVARASTVTSVSMDDLREIYLRRRRVWPDGSAIVAINLPPENPARLRFSRRVLGRTPAELLSYWNARYFEGITPPLVLHSPAAVRAYVAQQPGAIGYVPRSEVGNDLRVLLELRD